MANNLKKMRERAGMSVNQLAKKVESTALTIQRIESNKHPSPVDLAMRLSIALDAPINSVFPGAAKALAALHDELAGSTYIPAEWYARLRAIGLEGDARLHVLKVLLRGHPEPVFFDLLAHEVDRIFRAVQGEGEESSFIVFDTDHLRVAINLKATMFCQFLWDADFKNVVEAPPPDALADKDHSFEQVVVYFAENLIPVTISVEGENEDVDDEGNYMHNIFAFLEGDVLAYERLHIVDDGGESAFLRAGDITLITVPLWVLDSDEYVEDEDDAPTQNAN